VLNTAKLRQLVRSYVDCDTDEWYIWAAQSGGNKLKPRYLDLCNPLSANVFHRDITQLPDGAIIVFTPMEPPRESLLLKNGRPFLTELMIEV